MLDDEDLEQIELSLKTTIKMIEDYRETLDHTCMIDMYLKRYKKALDKIQISHEVKKV